MVYTKKQIAELGIRPRERWRGKKGQNGALLPCEAREVKAVAKDLKAQDELWQYWRLIPFADGYAWSRRHKFEEWIDGEVEAMWYDIGTPVFDGDGSWSMPGGGWWPYLDKEYLDVSWLRVGKALIDMDEVFTTVRNVLEEMVAGYRMGPGMALYRTVRKWFEARERGASGEALDAIEGEMMDLAQSFPTETSKSIGDREWYDYSRYIRKGAPK